ncbi:MAG: hypothetical protein ACRD50_16640 [Candidatus Acidiferrales bacterium]
MSITTKSLSYLIQLAGLGVFAVGAVLSMHHIAIAACFSGGAAAIYVGGKIRTTGL